MSKRTGARNLGELERAVMEVLWQANGDDALTVRDVHNTLAKERDIAYTTVMTVLDRLARKGTVVRTKNGRAHEYRPRGSRAEMTAEVMHGTLAEFAPESRSHALVAFVDGATPEDLQALRQALASLES